MAAIYAEIGRVGKLQAVFQQVRLIKMSWNFHNIVMKHHLLKLGTKYKICSQKKKKKKKKKKNHFTLYYRDCLGLIYFLAKHLILE